MNNDFIKVSEIEKKSQKTNNKENSTSYLYASVKRVFKNKIAVAAFCFLMFLVVLSILGPFITKYLSGNDYRKMDLDNQFLPIGIEAIKKHFYFGTDELGRDLFSRVLQGGRISLLIAFFTVIIEGFLGVFYGGISGYFGGKIDAFMIRVVEIISAVPELLYIIMLMVLVGPGVLSIIIAMAISRWMTMALIVRSEVLKIKERDYVMAAKVLGASHYRIITKHLIPNAFGQIIVRLTLAIPGAIFYEAFLSFIGIGVPVPQASWGRMIVDGFRQLHIAPHLFFIPALFISVTMIAFNLLGNALKEAFDPNSK